MSTLRALVLLLMVTGAAPPALDAQRAPSPRLATALSAGSTLLGVGLIPVAGQIDAPAGAYIAAASGALLLIGPSTGFFYTGETGRGVQSILWRLGGLGLMAVGVGMAGDDDAAPGLGLLVLGGAFGAASVLYDIAMVHRTADEPQEAWLQVGVGPGWAGVRIPLGR